MSRHMVKRKQRGSAARRGGAGFGIIKPAGVHPLFISALGGALMLAAWRKKDIIEGGSIVLETVKETIFKQVIPAGAQPYADLILAESKAAGIDPMVVVAIGQRESQWGAALRQGTGDFIVRGSEWKTGTKQVPSVPAGWSPPRKRKDGSIPTPPYSIPADGLGWGRGLMQIDYPNVVKMGIDWATPQANISAAIKGWIKPLYAQLRGKIPEGADLTKAVMAAYNAGAGPVLSAYASGGINAIDRITTQNYGSGTMAILADLYSKLEAATA